MATEPGTSRFKDMTNATPEEWEADRAYLNRKLSEAELEERRKALKDLHALWQSILDRTGGKGISAEDLEDAIRAAKDH